MHGADGFGLLPFVAWIFPQGDPWWMTLVKCLLISPGLMILIGLVFEFRLVPLSPREQFWGFMPGDVFLGLGAFTFIRLAGVNGGPDSWYRQHVWIQWGILAVTFLAWIGLTAAELWSRDYDLRTELSPTKLYHNSLYCWYAYIVASAAVGGLFALVRQPSIGDFGLLSLGLAAIVIWAVCAFYMDTHPRFQQLPPQAKALRAHIQGYWWWEQWAAGAFWVAARFR